MDLSANGEAWLTEPDANTSVHHNTEHITDCLSRFVSCGCAVN